MGTFRMAISATFLLLLTLPTAAMAQEHPPIVTTHGDHLITTHADGQQHWKNTVSAAEWKADPPPYPYPAPGLNPEPNGDMGTCLNPLSFGRYAWVVRTSASCQTVSKILKPAIRGRKRVKGWKCSLKKKGKRVACSKRKQRIDAWRGTHAGAGQALEGIVVACGQFFAYRKHYSLIYADTEKACESAEAYGWKATARHVGAAYNYPRLPAQIEGCRSLDLGGGSWEYACLVDGGCLVLPSSHFAPRVAAAGMPGVKFTALLQPKDGMPC